MILLTKILVSTSAILVILSGLWVASALWHELKRPKS